MHRERGKVNIISALLTLMRTLYSYACSSLKSAPHSYACSSLLRALITLTWAPCPYAHSSLLRAPLTLTRIPHSYARSSLLRALLTLTRAPPLTRPPHSYARSSLLRTLASIRMRIDRTNIVGSGWAINTLTVLLITAKVILMKGRKTNYSIRNFLDIFSQIFRLDHGLNICRYQSICLLSFKIDLRKYLAVIISLSRAYYFLSAIFLGW
jgi:hypothetical protein